MRNVDQYLDQAIEVLELGSDSQLSRRLGLNHGAVNSYRSGRALPSSKTMRKLAQLCGWDEQVALIELAFWKSEGNDEREVLQQILRKISALLPATAAGIAFMAPTAAEAAEKATEIAVSMPGWSVAAVVGVYILRETECFTKCRDTVYYGNNEVAHGYIIILILNNIDGSHVGITSIN